MGSALLEIFTLGKFQVRKEDSLISEHTGHSNKVWELFQYLLSKTGEIVSPEKIIEDLNFNLDMLDAKNALENRIYRLRKILATGEKYQADKYISYRHGGYSLKEKEYCWYDFLEFKDGCARGESLRQAGSKVDALDFYLPALELYQGDYLNNKINPHWAVAPRVLYKQLYLETLNQTCDILKEFQEYQKIEELCQRAVQIEPFEERPHYILLETLWKKGHKRKARQHYALVETLFAEQGLTPFPELKKIFQEEQNSPSAPSRGIFNLDQIKSELTFSTADRDKIKIFPSYLCNDFAEALHRRSKRYEEELFMASIALEFCRQDFSRDKEESCIDILQKAFKQSLRNSDIICQWTEQQYIIFFSGVKEVKLREILERIKNDYYNLETNSGTIINTSYRLL